MIITAILIYTNYAQVLQARVLNLFPGYSRFLGQFENNSGLQKELDNLAGRKAQTIAEDSQKLLSEGGSAPEFAGIAQWLNTPTPLSLQALQGKVVLVDFWTYSCINCVRTLPHLTAWYERYKNDGLVIVGVHTPEFAFEREAQNVRNAIKQFNITYPVAQDNDYQIWQSYQNHYWPAEYLIDAKGHIRRTHFGEGGYDHMEEAIRALLKENGHAIDGDLSSCQRPDPMHVIALLKRILGTHRMQRFASPEKILTGDQAYYFTGGNAAGSFCLSRHLECTAQFAKSGPGAALEFKIQCRQSFFGGRTGTCGG